MVIIEEGELVDWDSFRMLVIIDGCQVVCFVTVFRSPIKTVGILGAEAELGGYVKRPDATLDEAILFRNKIIQICLVRIRGVGDGGAVLQFADRRKISRDCVGVGA